MSAAERIPRFGPGNPTGIPGIGAPLLALALLLGNSTAASAATPEATVAQLEYERAPASEFRSFLTDEDADLRRRAALALGRVTPAGGTALLLPLLEDPEPAVQAMAAFSLGQLADTTAVEALIDAAGQSDSHVAEEALLALGKIGGERAADGAARYLGHETPMLRGAAALALARMADTTQVATMIHQLDSETSSRVLWEVIRALENAPATDRLIETLMPQLDARSPAVRASTARTLGRLGDQRAVRPLLRLLIDDEWRVRVEACRALGTLGSTAAIEALLPLVADPLHHVREVAVDALGGIGGPIPPPILERAAADPAIAVRRAAARALATVESERAMELLATLIADPAPAVAADALVAMAQRAEADPFELCVEYTDDDYPAPVRAAAVTTLGELGDVGALAILVDLLEDDDWVIATLAADALGELRDNAAEASLVDAYTRSTGFEEFDVRLTVVEALARTGTARARPLLLEAALDRDPRLRVRALAALDSIATRAEPRLAATWAYEDSVIAATPTTAGGPRLGQPPPDFPLTEPELPHRARMVTSRGTIEIELFPEIAPNTVASFVRLAASGFYDQAVFHRVVPDFVIQGGCPRGDGWGGPGYALRSEWSPEHYDVGTVGMAHAGKDTAGSQFFITHSPQPHLDGRYTVFGRVTSGMSVVDTVEQGDRFSVLILDD